MAYLFVVGLAALAVTILSIKMLAAVTAAIILKIIGFFSKGKESEAEEATPL